MFKFLMSLFKIKNPFRKKKKRSLERVGLYKVDDSTILKIERYNDITLNAVVLTDKDLTQADEQMIIINFLRGEYEDDYLGDIDEEL